MEHLPLKVPESIASDTSTRARDIWHQIAGPQSTERRPFISQEEQSRLVNNGPRLLAEAVQEMVANQPSKTKRLEFTTAQGDLLVLVADPWGEKFLDIEIQSPSGSEIAKFSYTLSSDRKGQISFINSHRIVDTAWRGRGLGDLLESLVCQAAQQVANREDQTLLLQVWHVRKKLSQLWMLSRGYQLPTPKATEALLTEIEANKKELHAQGYEIKNHEDDPEFRKYIYPNTEEST